MSPKDGAPMIERKAIAPADPLKFIVELTAILKTETMASIVEQEVVSRLLALPDIDGAWIMKPKPDGRLLESACCPGCPEEYRALAGRAWQDATQQTSFLAVAIPLSGGARRHGVLVLRAKNTSFLRAWTGPMLAFLASVIGNALESCAKEAALEHAQRLYKTLFNCVDQLLGARAEDRALRRLCKALVDSELFVSAGIGIVGADGVHRHIAAAARRNVRALREASLTYEKNQTKRPLTFDAWETGNTVVANKYFSDARFEPVFWLARKLGFQSIAALILRRGGAPWAILNVSAAEEDYFDDALIQLLERMTDMVGRVLDELDLKATLRAEREIQRRIAREDMLTTLPNRRAFHEELAGRMASGRQNGATLTVAMLDLNDFKEINDRWGHAAGDHVLRVVGGRIRTVLRETDFAGRLGGDEFALILDGFLTLQGKFEEGLEVFCSRLQRAVSAPVAMPHGQVAHVSLSAGFAMLSPDDASADSLLRRADRALYEAKAENGQRGRFWCVCPGQAASADPRLNGWYLLQSGALETYFQPVLNLETGQVTKMEALARLRDGAETMLPAKFLPQMNLEERNLLFCKMLEASIRQVAMLARDGFKMSVAVNLDGQILLLERTLPFIKKVLADNHVSPTALILEILETHDFFSLQKAGLQINAVKALGVRIALDDVGTGHSSLLKLRDLPLDIVKLDRAFVARLREHPDDLIVIATLQAMTANLGMMLIVEGAEDDVVLEALRIVGVRQAQGYAIARPMNPASLSQWRRDYRPREVPKTPQSPLGAYALHSKWRRAIEFCQSNEEILAQLLHRNLFCLSDYFAGPGAGLAEERKAYEKLTMLMKAETVDMPALMAADLAFRQQMIAAVRLEAGQGKILKRRRA